MGDRSRSGLVNVVCLALALVGLTAHRATAATEHQFSVTMVDAGGRFIDGGSRLWHTGSGLLHAGWRDDGAVDIYVDGGEPSESYHFEFAPPEGEQLQVGSYTDVGESPWQEADQAGMDVSGESLGCGGGRFRVLDVDPATNRLWLVYQACGDDRAAVFGEIRINVPQQSSQAMVAPTVVAWSGYYPGEPARPVPVRVVNTGAEPLTVGEPGVTGGAGSFSVEGSDCWTLAPEESCVVYVGFNPGGAGRHEAVLTIPSSGPTWSVPLSGRGLPGHNVWALRSSEGDPVGNGRDYLVDPVTKPLFVVGTSREVRIGAGGFTARFAAPAGRSLASGTFDDVTWGEMHVEKAYRECDEVHGSFVVHDSAFGPSGEVRRLRLSFEQYCDGSRSALFGSLAWRARKAAVALPPRVHLDATKYHLRRGGDTVVKATLEDGAPDRRVSLLEQRRDGTHRVLATERLSGGETLRVRRTIHRRTSFTVRSAGREPIVTSSLEVRLSRG